MTYEGNMQIEVQTPNIVNFHGWGTIIMNDGSLFEGPFEEDLMQGIFKVTSAEGGIRY